MTLVLVGMFLLSLLWIWCYLAVVAIALFNAVLLLLVALESGDMVLVAVANVVGHVVAWCC